MRKFLKNKILDILFTMYEAHKDISKLMDNEEFNSVNIMLEDCQNAAINIGTYIESAEGEGSITVRFLEEYCETVYQVSQSMLAKYKGKNAQKLLDKKLIRVENSLNHDIKINLEIVFMPYKSSMWDSLESIWKAVEEDPDCNAYVVPIPYYERTACSSSKYHYEGGDFPKYVPVVDYEAYSLEKRRPDIIYIHNPYDGDNCITSVDPRFYSVELKKYTDRLVYIPYFFANHKYTYEHIERSAYFNIDAIIVQNELCRQQYKDTLFYDKVHALGSAKLDCIKNYYNEKRYPAQLRGLPENVKKIFLNTSISYLLKDTDLALNKIEYIIRTFIELDDVFVVWRPHPLLDVTLKSMRPECYQRFIELKKMFLNQCNGMYDTEMNIDELVAVSDAYIGEETSSIVIYFASLGKPVFIIDDEIIEKEQCAISFFDFYFKDKDIYFADSEYKVICKADLTTGKIEKMTPITYQNFSQSRAYTMVKYIDDKLWFAPMNGEEIVIYDINDSSIKQIDIGSCTEKGMPNYNKIIQKENALYFIPVMNDKLLRIDTDSYNIVTDEKVVGSIKNNAIEKGYYSMFASCIRNNVIYIASPLSNVISSFDTQNGRVKEYKVGNKNKGYWDMICDGDDIWLNPYCGHAIVKWNPDSEVIYEYDNYPEGFVFNTRDKDYFIQFVDCDQYILAFPKCANMIVSIDKKSGEMSKYDVKLDYKEGKRKNKKYTWGSNYYFAKRVDNTVYALSAYDHALITIDIYSKEVKKTYFTVDKEISDYSTGIIKEKTMCSDVRKCFFYESDKMLIEEFIKLIQEGKIGINDTEKNLVADDFINNDGTAGKAIHEFNKNRI